MFFQNGQGFLASSPAGAIAPGTTITSPTLVGPALSGTLTGASGARILMPSGTKTLPPYGFTADDDAGLFYASGPALTMADTLIATVKATGLDVTPVALLVAAATLSGVVDGRATAGARIMLPVGSVGAPPLAIGAAGDDGLYAAAAADLRIALAGALEGRLGVDVINHGETVAGTAISHGASKAPIVVVRVKNTTGVLVTMTATPMVQAGLFDGQLLVLCSDETSTAGILISDDGTVPGSALQLAGTTVTLSARDSIALRWNAADSTWITTLGAFTNVA